MKLSTILSAAVMSASLMAFANQANAACVYLNWTNSNASHPIHKVKGRICGNNLAVKMSGGGQSMGWTSVSKVGANTYAGSYTSASVTNKFKITVHDSNKTMNMRINTQYTNGNNKVWFAHFRQN